MGRQGIERRTDNHNLQKLVEIEGKIRNATQAHNQFLKQLGQAPCLALPGVMGDQEGRVAGRRPRPANLLSYSPRALLTRFLRVPSMNDLILYSTEDGRSQIKLRAKDQTVWLSQREMAQLFDVSTDNVGLHLKNIFDDGELSREATTEESSVVQIEGGREVQRLVTLYDLDAILAVGYRVRSPRGVQFRRWVSTVLKEYLLKGFVMDDERLKNPDGRPDYFDEMLERIRDIRASEKRFYQKVRDLFALSSDYDKTDKATQTFFATVQNLLIFAVTQKTAAELITARANPADPHFEQMEGKTNALYLDYGQRRKTQEALAADQEDEADLKALVTKLKRRPRKT